MFDGSPFHVPQDMQPELEALIVKIMAQYHTVNLTIPLIEERHGVKIVYACEAGSRAWGFDSKDSDYDIRFLYVHHPDWYLAVNSNTWRDVIELPPTPDWDISGWDLRKALRLLQKGNPPLTEWLRSPIVYFETDMAEKMRKIIELRFNALPCYYHYLHMAEGNVREYLQGESVWVKKYLYVIRPLLAALWVRDRNEFPPVDMDELVDGSMLQPHITGAIKSLVESKRMGMELSRGPKIPILEQFIHDVFEDLKTAPQKRVDLYPGDFDLDCLFRETLKREWETK
jgi:predicted nucleotidyltransferase